MKKFNKYLYDNINREYDRRNLYLYEVSALQEEIEAATGKEKQELKNKLNELVRNKKDHAYNKKLAEYKRKSNSLEKLKIRCQSIEVRLILLYLKMFKIYN